MAENSDDTVFFSNPIDVDAWNQAKWQGVLYLTDPSGNEPPVLALFFEDETAGRKIFNDWRQRFGERDAKEDLRIAIIEGFVPGQEPGYYVHVGFDLDRAFERAGEQGHPDLKKLWTITRIKRLDAPNSPNLAVFKKAFARHGRYVLAPAFVVGGQVRPWTFQSRRRKSTSAKSRTSGRTTSTRPCSTWSDRIEAVAEPHSPTTPPGGLDEGASLGGFKGGASAEAECRADARSGQGDDRRARPHRAVRPVRLGVS